MRSLTAFVEYSILLQSVAGCSYKERVSMFPTQRLSVALVTEERSELGTGTLAETTRVSKIWLGRRPNSEPLERHRELQFLAPYCKTQNGLISRHEPIGSAAFRCLLTLPSLGWRQ